MIKIFWSKNAKEELTSITKYWNKRNKSTLYSSKIKLHIELALNLITDQTKLGLKSNIKDVRMKLILRNYYLIYQIKNNQIQVLQFWDVRQNPIKTKFKKE
jgi:addiction module RelE/StbE family toxin